MSELEKKSEPTLLDRIVMRRATSPRYVNSATDIPGVLIRHEDGTRSEILQRNLGKLAVRARMMTRRKFNIDRMKSRQAKNAEEVRDMVVAHPGLLGVIDKASNTQVVVVRKQAIDWDQEKLRQAIGVHYPSVVSEEFKATLTVPAVYETNEGQLTPELLRTKFNAVLTELGVPEEDIASILKTDVSFSVDEDHLGRLITEERVSLPEDTGVVTDSFTIIPGPFIKSHQLK